MFSLTWMFNGAAVAAIQLFFLNECVKQSRISKLKHMPNKTGYLLALDFFPLCLPSTEGRRSLRLPCLELSCKITGDNDKCSLARIDSENDNALKICAFILK